METIATRLAILPFPEIDPVIFTIGAARVRLVRARLCRGILLGWLYARRIIQETLRSGATASPPSTWRSLTTSCSGRPAGIVLGGRIGYILFYDLGSILENPVRAIQIWNGGHVLPWRPSRHHAGDDIFARRNAIPLWSLFRRRGNSGADRALLRAHPPISSMEKLWGRLSSMPWAVVFPREAPSPVIPVKLYEAALEASCFWSCSPVRLSQSLQIPGLVTGIFVCGYAASRIFVEFFREPGRRSAVLRGTGLPGMVLSLPMYWSIWAIARARSAVHALDGQS